ncbi:hypothetical protein GCM10009557_46270 [Virgisporangium ochraceum]|uniref:Uncharacterized protein n=1 Tax=Virgisporangium ochraceum TaxID=65505 RepID=A0A8J3ZSG8_9ACTN|nr:hypothetical protein Voc01_040210 [Virgisporangium ochraceum]
MATGHHPGLLAPAGEQVQGVFDAGGPFVLEMRRDLHGDPFVGMGAVWVAHIVPAWRGRRQGDNNRLVNRRVGARRSGVASFRA